VAIRRTWVLGGGGARGAAQVGVMTALFEAGIEPPSALVGVSVGALNAASIAAFPSLGGAAMLRQTWLSKLARDVFNAHPLGILLSRLRGVRLAALPAANVQRLIQHQLRLVGISDFEHLKLPLAIVATDVGAGRRHIFRTGPLAPALQASTAIPGIFPPVSVEEREYMDGGIVDNTPLDVAVDDGARHVLAISLMAGGESDGRKRTWSTLIARTLQLALHQQMLSDYERLKGRATVVVLCPVLAATDGWDMRPQHVEAMIEGARKATADVLRSRGSRLFKRSAIHFLELPGSAQARAS
jgi:NTE family protein